jgi:hypothetical protein
MLKLVRIVVLFTFEGILKEDSIYSCIMALGPN